MYFSYYLTFPQGEACNNCEKYKTMYPKKKAREEYFGLLYVLIVIP